MGKVASFLARAVFALPLLCIPAGLASCTTEAHEYGHDEYGPIDRAEDILEEYPELCGVLMGAKDYLREHTREVLASAAPVVAEDGEYEGKVMVFGAVCRPVIVPLEPSMRVTQVIDRAQGLRRDANWRCVLVVRRRECFERSRLVVVDYLQVVRYGDLAQDLPLQPKDVIFVPWEGRDRRLYMEPIATYLKRERPLARLVNQLEKLGR